MNTDAEQPPTLQAIDPDLLEALISEWCVANGVQRDSSSAELMADRLSGLLKEKGASFTSLQKMLSSNP